MKKLLGIIVLGLLFGGNAYSKSYTGEGEVKLSNQVISNFQNYIKLKKIKGQRADPGIFMITLDGSKSYYYYCTNNLGGGCVDNAGYYEMKVCKSATKKECRLFARKRRVLWKNGINDGKRKSQFNSKMSNSEMKEKLASLGFIGDATSSTTNKKKAKITKKKSEDKDIVAKLKDLKKLLDDGALTKEEFEKAKKKLLN
tara:strand:+ start:38 stop:634 length:597 start_codon:yes stop_codon:yes gene_type:complete